MTTEPPNPENGIKTGEPAAAPAPSSESVPSPDVIPLPPLPSPLPPHNPHWQKYDYVLLLLFGVLACLLGVTNTSNPDFWRHLATGRAIAQGSHSFGVDPFSFASTTQDGAAVPWVNHAWLYDLALYGVWSAAGDHGRIAVTAAHALLLLGVLFFLVRTRAADAGPLGTLTIAGLAALAVSHFVAINSLPLSYLLLAALLALLCRGGFLDGLGENETLSTRSLWAAPLLFVFWVNVDEWFILGFVVLLMCVAGNACATLLGRKMQLPLRIQIGVLLASGAACLINPFHVHALRLPPELAYLLGGWLPATLGGSGGAAVRDIAQVSPEALGALGLVGPFHASFTAVWTVVKVAYFVLSLVSLVSFVLVVLYGLRADGPKLSLARLLVWLLFAGLSLAAHRMIPFFALVAAPVAVLNFGEVARWRRRQPGWDPAQGFNPNLGRLALTMLALIALGLVWPGWLHDRFLNFASSRRVAWQVSEDVSLRGAAEALAELKAQRVFNYTFDIANYCAWFAPGTRCYLDQRFSLFGDEAALYAKAKMGIVKSAGQLLDGQQDPAPPGGGDRKEEGWSKLFRRKQIDQLALARFDSLQQKIIIAMCWLQPESWAQRYADGRSFVFSWSPTGEAPKVDFAGAWRREAFGPVPEARRAPLGGSVPPQGGMSLQALYLEGEPANSPRDAMEPAVHLFYFNLIKEKGLTAYRPAWRIASWLAPAGLCGVVPFGVSGPMAPLFELMPPRQSPQGPVTIFDLVQPRDAGPPAAPLLMVRLARRAVHDHPYDARGYLALFQAYKWQNEFLEGRWLQRAGLPVDRTGRHELRQIQMITALRNYLELRPDDFAIRQTLANMLLQQNHGDAALEELMRAQKGIEQARRQERDKKAMEARKAEEKSVGDFIKKLERDLKRRREDFKLKSTRFDALRKYYVAVIEPHGADDPENPRGMGLSLEGLQQLQNVTPESLPRERRAEVHFHRFRLLMQLGRQAEAFDDLQALIDMGSPAVREMIVWHYAALGSYGDLDRALAELERPTVDAVAKLGAQYRNLIVSLMQQSANTGLPGLVRIPAVVPQVNLLFQAETGYQSALEDLSNRRTLRGLSALEAGDTAAAAKHFAEALRGDGSNPLFFDRPIAERYLELVREQGQARP